MVRQSPPARQERVAAAFRRALPAALLRGELGELYFFDRISFSPRLRELEAERDDIRLVLAEELG